MIATASVSRGNSSQEWAALLECASPLADFPVLHKMFCELHWPTMLGLAAEHGVIAQLAKVVDPWLIVELHTERTMRYFPRPLPIEKFFERRSFVELDGREIPALMSGR